MAKALLGGNYSSDVDALDPDGDPVKYLLTASPDGMTIDPVTGQISWKASVPVGQYAVAVQVTDGHGGTVTQSFTVEVINVAPSTIAGSKFHDLNGNGIWDGGSLSSAPGGEATPATDLQISPFYSDVYSVYNLGTVPGLPTPYGGLTLKTDDPNTLLIGGSADSSPGALYAIEVVRGADNHIIGFKGTTTKLAAAPYIDGGASYGPDGVLFTAHYPTNQIMQFKPGSTTADKVISLTQFGVAGSSAALNFVPPGFPGEGRLKIASWSGGQWYDATFSPDGRGTFNLDKVTQVPGSQLSGGPTGLAYVPLGAEHFDTPSALVAEWRNSTSGNIVSYKLNNNGDPIVATRQLFLPNLAGALGAFIDPLTGDFLFSTFSFGSGNRVVAVQGFKAPQPSEPGLDDWIIYIDANRNGQRDEGERFTQTDKNGNYSFPNLLPGTYLVAEELKPGWEQTAPTSHTYEVTVAAGGAIGHIDFGNIEVETEPENLPPTFTSSAPTDTRVGELFRYNALATDPDRDVLSYDLPIKPEGMVIDPETGTVLWNSGSAQVGLHDVIVRVTDSSGAVDLQGFQVNVLPPNNQPTFTSKPVEMAVVELPYEYPVRAQDADSDAIAYQLDNPPTGMSIDPTTGLIRWTPATNQLGQQLITVTASDGRGGVSTQSFNLTTVASAPNDTPVITSAPRLKTGLGSPYLYNVQAIDPNGDPLTYTLATAPAGMTLDERGRVFWQPTSTQFGSNPVKIVVADGRSGVAQQEFAIDVRSQSINQPPSIESEPSNVATAQQQYQYNPIATDPDGDPLFWSLDAAPVGMSIDPETGKLRWKPRLEQVGTHEVAVRVMDSSGTYVGQAFTLNVRGVNVPPAIISTPPTVAAAGKPYSYAVIAPDPENDTVQFFLNHAPAGMNIDPNTGLIQWTPQLGQVGTQNVEILVTDASGGTAVQRYAAVVAETAANLPPAITSTPAFAAAVGNLYEYKVTATDPDGTISGYQLLKAPQGMVMDPNGKIAWNPTSLQLGTHEVVVGAVDNSGSGSAQGFTLTVAESLPPENPGINPVQSVTVGKPYRYDVKATDFGVGPLHFKLTIAPVGMTIDGKGRLSWLPNSTNIGPHPIEIEVTDAAGKSATLFFNLNVSADIVHPQVSLALSSDTVNVGEKVTFAVSAVDNVNVESLSLTVNGQKVALDAQGKATVPMNVVGVFTASATAVDAAGNVGETTQTISVTTPNVATVPAIDIPTLEDGTVINATFNIIGTINSSDLNHYALEIAPLSGGEFKEIYRSQTTVENGVLAKLDPSVLANDTYILRFKVVENNGSISTIERIVNVASEFKLGNIQLSYTDLNIPLSGIPITITRSYDSLNANAKEELGYGWRLAELDTDLRTNLIPDEVAQELEVYTIPFEQETKVFVNVPGGKREMFTFRPKPHRLSQFLRNPETGQPLLYVPTFVSGPGSTNKLTVADAPITKVGNEYYGMNGEPFNPENPLFWSRYFLTNNSGIVYEIDAKSGDLVAAKAPDGNQLTYSESGITSSQGPSVLFGRDAAGRIVTVTDPQGKQIRYDYDDKGDFIALTNRDNKTTKYIYNDTEKPHFIQKLIDHNGQVIYQQTGLGFVNRPPVIVPGTIKTHQELEIEIPLPKFVTDPDGDNLSYQVINPVGGTVRLKADGKTAVFTPFPGVKGVANFDLIANDGYGPVQVTMQVNVSDAPLLNLDFAQLNPRLNAVENTELVVLGDFADAQDVVLPDSYLTYASSMPTVAQVDVNGVVTGVADGVAILSATRNNVQAVTPVRVGELPTPTKDTELSVAIAELYGLDPYPDAISLTEGATRKLSLGLNSDFLQPNLTADANTRYFVSNSNVLNVSPDGVITAVGVGDATVTAIYGAASVAIPVRVEAGQVGPTTLGVSGGVAFSSDRTATVMIPPGALDEETTVSITPKNRESLSLPIPAGFEFAGAFNLDFNGGSLNLPTQLAMPAPEGLAAGTQVYFMRKGAIPDETGTWNSMWLQEESGVVGADGMIRTSSPPYPGVVRPGEYAVVYSSPTGSASLVKGKLTLNYNFPLAFFGIIDPLGGIGQLIEPDNFITTPAFTVTEDISSVKVVAVPKVGLPVVTEVGVRRNQDGILTFETALNMPAPGSSDPTAAPVLQKAELKFKDEFGQEFENKEPLLFLTGGNVLVKNGKDLLGSRFEDLTVKFYVSDRVYKGTVVPNRSRELGNNQFEVAVKVPNTVPLGASRIVLERKQNQIIDQSGTAPLYKEIHYDSNKIQLSQSPEYILAALEGAESVAILDGTDPQSTVLQSNSSNLLLATIPVGTSDRIDRPRDLAVTSDGTRAYTVLEGSGRVALIDPMVLQQIDTQPLTNGVNPIELPLAAKPRSIVISPRDEYAYIADGERGEVYILDIDPYSTTYHQIIKTITIDAAAPRGLRSLAISSEGRKLFVTAPGFPNSQIVVINIDPKDRPRDANQNPQHWHEMIGKVQVGAGSEGISATSDPLKMTYANSRGDHQGFGLLSVTNDDPKAFAAEIKEVPLGLGGFLDYFDVNEGVSVAITRDGSYGFVVGRNADTRFFGQEIESIDGVQAGSNIGIIKDPLTNPKLVAATRPIPNGFATELVLSNDNKYLYASYPGLSRNGDVYVFDVEEMIKTLNQPEDYQIDNFDRGIKSVDFKADAARAASVDDLARVPIDDINPAISIAADYGITYEDRVANKFVYSAFPGSNQIPIGTKGSPGGLSAAPADWLDLMGPIGTSKNLANPLTPNFQWNFGNLPNQDVKEVNLFVSVFDEGNGLLPWDQVVDLSAPNGNEFLFNQGLSKPEQLDLLTKPWNISNYGKENDFNPNRILTATWQRDDEDGIGKWTFDGGKTWTEGSNTSFTLPKNRTLTAGQEYNWAVEAWNSNGKQNIEFGNFWTPLPEALNGDDTFRSVTVLTHGFKPPFFSQPGIPGEFYEMADSIANAGVDGDGLIVRYDRSTGYWVPINKYGQVLANFQAGLNPKTEPDYLTKLESYIAPYLEANKPWVILNDWSRDNESVVPDSGFTEAAADSFFASLVQLDGLFKDEGSSVKQGALFNSPLHFIGFSRGAVVNSEIIQRLGTYFPEAGGKENTGIRDLQMTTLDPHDFDQPGLNVITQNFGDFREPKVQVWDNVTFADNYYQTVPNLLGGTITPAGRDFPNLPFTEAGKTASGLQFPRQGWRS
ncbi:MAG TPA: putative Ig domain-containing protein [Candidatus Sericytochromatia bacterium]